MGDNQYTISIGTDADTSTVEELATKLQEVENAANTAGTAIESINGTSLDEAGSAADTAATSLDEASSSASELGAGFDEAANSADGAAAAAEEVENATESASETSVLGAGAATAAVATLTAGLEGTAQSAESANATFEKMSSTTFPEEQVRAMVANLTNVKFNTDDALLYIKTLKQIGLTVPDALSRGATAFNRIQVATGVSSDQVVRFSNSMVAMGIDMNNIPSTFNAIAYANANMVGGFQTYIDWMAKYDSTFKSMGLNVDQTAVLISAATKKFGGGRAAYSGLNEAIKESGGNLSEIEKQLGMQPGSLQNASAATEKYSGKIEKNAQISEDHTTIMQKAKAALEDLSIQYSGIYGPIAQYGGAISGVITFMGTMVTMKAALATAANTAALAQTGENVATNEGVLSKIRGSAATVGNTAAKWGNSAATYARSAAQSVENTVTNLGIGTKIRDTASTVASTVVTGAKTTATYAAAAAQWALNAAMSANPIAIIIILIVALVAIILYLWSTNEGFRNAVIGIWNAISGAFIFAGQQIYNTLAWIWSGIVWFLGLIPQLPLLVGLYLAAAALRFVLFAATAVANARSAGLRIISAIGSTLAALPGSMYTWGMNALMSFINGIINMIPGLSSALSLVSNLFPHSPPKTGPLSTITAANMYNWMLDIAYAGMSGFSNFSLNGINTTYPSISASAGYGSASLGFDATEINSALSANSNENSKAQIIQYIDLNGIMSEEEAATTIVNAIVEQAEKENLITGKS